jgi:hypothetical protein
MGLLKKGHLTLKTRFFSRVLCDNLGEKPSFFSELKNYFFGACRLRFLPPRPRLRPPPPDLCLLFLLGLELLLWRLPGVHTGNAVAGSNSP